MFRLIKLAVYGLLGYAIFEFVRGFAQGGQCGSSAAVGRGGSRDLNRALDEGSSRSNLTGPARGERVVTNDSDGGAVPHVVGRGVVH